MASANDASVVLKLIDNYSANLKSISNANKGFNKEMEALRTEAAQVSSRLTDLREKQSKYETTLREMKTALDSAAKAHKELNTEVSRDDLTKAQEDYHRAKDAVTAWGAACKATEKQLLSLGEQARRLSDVPSGGATPNGGTAGTLLKASANSGFWNMGKQVVFEAGGFLAGSALGDTAADYISSSASGALSGAAIGSVLGPIGTVSGAVAGGVAGLISAGIKEAGKHDDYFKSAVQEAYNDIHEYRDEQVSTGSSTYGGRETLLLSYKTLMGGDETAAQNLYGSLLDYANRTPYTLGELSGAGRTLLAYGYEGGDIQNVLGRIGSAAAATGSGAQGLDTMAQIIGRLNTGEISARLFRSLNALGMNSYQTLANQYNLENGTALTSAEMKEYVSKGRVTGEWAAEALLTQWGDNWGSAMTEFSQTFEGLVSTLNGLQENRQAEVGEQYNDTRKSAVQEEIEYLNSEIGQVVTGIEGYYGEVQASVENTQERYQREAEKSLVTGATFSDLGDDVNSALKDLHEQYLERTAELRAAEANGDELAAQTAKLAIAGLLDSARAEAESAWQNSDLFHVIQDKEMDLIGKLQDATYDTWYDYGYQIADALSKGAMAAAMNAGTYQGEHFQGSFMAGDVAGTHAYGLSRVPYDGYIAQLHEGERVLTAAEARRQDGGQDGGIVVNLGNVTVNDRSDAEMLAEIIVQRLVEAKKTFVR